MTTTGPRHCPACGSTRVTPRLVHHWRCEACGVTDWKNPQPVAGTFIVRDGRVLLVRRSEAMEHGPGGWVFPGGFVERGETPWQGAVRETQEEAGVSPRILRALPPRTVLEPHNIVMPFLAELDDDQEPAPGVECQDARWFGFDEIPWAEIPFSSTIEALRGIVDGDLGTPTFREVGSPGRARAPLRFCVRCGTPVGGPGEDGAVRCPDCGAMRWDNPSPAAAFLA
ncbi:MAG: NUDIX domain-containing protein, partial [Dehalococcoidia bacterium]